jgi:hypothetical protein
MALIPPFFIDCVVAIGRENPKTGKIRWTASGFFYGRFVEKVGEEGKKYLTYLITNKHVLEGTDRVFIRLNPQDLNQAKEYTVPLKDGEKVLWEGHSRKGVDVAVIPVNWGLFKKEQMAVQYFRSDEHCLDGKSMKNSGVFEGDSVYLLGFPMGLVGEKRSSVIVRAGSLARVRDTFEKATQPFLVDVFAFPGNSGGPVVTKPEAMSIEGTASIQRSCLVGVVAAYVPYQDISVSVQTMQPTITISQNSGLAQVFSVDCIRQTVKRYEQRDSRAKKEAEPQKSTKPSEEASDASISSM